MHPFHRATAAAGSRRLLYGVVCTACIALLTLLPAACSSGGESGSVTSRRHGEETVGKEKLPSAESRLGDAILHFEVKARLLDALHWDAVGIEVDAADGRVVLSGEVPSSATRTKAEEIARSVEGVEGTESRLVLTTDGEAEPERRGGEPGERVSEAEQQVRDSLIESRLKVRLLQAMGSHGLGVQVEASNGVVTLRGRFENEAYEQTTLETATTTPGVKRLVNLIKI